MTEHAEVALRFSKECLGWETADGQYLHNGVIWNGKSNELSSGFHYADLNAVMEAVRKWCHTNKASVVLQWTPFSVGDNNYDCRITFPSSSKCGTGINKNPCHALMQACLIANAQLKAPA